LYHFPRGDASNARRIFPYFAPEVRVRILHAARVDLSTDYEE